MLRVVVFDFDGTLVDSNSIKDDCLYKTVGGLRGAEAVIADVLKRGGDRHKIFSEFAHRYFGESDPDTTAAKVRALVRQYGEYCYRGITAASERRGASQTLALLHRRGLRLWVLSATPVKSLRPLLRRRGFDRWLHGALGSPLTKVEGLRLIMRLERAQRRELLMVGDGFDDEAAARIVKVRFAGITLERQLPVRGRLALRDLHSLPALIEEFRGRARQNA